MGKRFRYIDVEESIVRVEFEEDFLTETERRIAMKEDDALHHPLTGGELRTYSPVTAIQTQIDASSAIASEALDSSGKVFSDLGEMIKKWGLNTAID